MYKLSYKIISFITISLILASCTNTQFANMLTKNQYIKINNNIDNQALIRNIKNELVQKTFLINDNNQNNIILNIDSFEKYKYNSIIDKNGNILKKITTAYISGSLVINGINYKISQTISIPFIVNNSTPLNNIRIQDEQNNIVLSQISKSFVEKIILDIKKYSE